MSKFRKKPIVIEAVQFDPLKNPWPEGVKPWPDAAGFQPRDTTWGYIETLEGRMHVSHGDWIITGVNGEKYPCKPDIFEKSYEAAEEKSVVGCWDCGKPYHFPMDVTLPNDQWSLIMGQTESTDDPGGLLCETCILIRASKLSGVVAARLVLDSPEALQTGFTPDMTVWQPGRWVKK